MLKYGAGSRMRVVAGRATVADGAAAEFQRDFDFDFILAETYRGEGFRVPVEGGTRVYQRQSTPDVDPWQNKAVAAFGVFLMIVGLTGIVLEKKLSRFH